MTAAPIDRTASAPAGAPAGALRAPSNGRLLAAPAPDQHTHLDTFGPLPTGTGPQILEQVRISGLTGRGGAGFPTAIKLQAVAAAPGPAVVVANGAEGEPASGKDLHLLRAAPHLVLDGLQIAALITGATEAYVHVRAEAAGAIRQALAERAGATRAGTASTRAATARAATVRAATAGTARAGTDLVRVTVVEAAAGFVSGQESAVVSRLNGGRALPAFAPVRASERGVHGRPTLVQNVETLAHLALIARYGGDWFTQAGTAGSSGTFLATVHPLNSGFGLDPATGPPPASDVWEVPHGLPLGRLLDASIGQRPARAAVSGPVGQAETDGVQAVLVGGFHGSWLALPEAGQAPLSTAGLAPFGGSLGAGVLIPLSTGGCGLALTARIVGYLASESAKQCGPCRFGLPHLAALTAALAAGTGGRAVLDAIRQTVGLVEGRGACHHPDGTARLVRSALVAFAADVRLHEQGRCLARISETYGGAR